MTSQRSSRGIVKRFARDASGNVLILSALSLPVIIGCAGLAVEYGSAVSLRAENQRVSDLAAYAGAVAYSQEQSENRMRAAALNVVAINGGDPANATVRLVASPVDADNLAVRVDIVARQSTVLSSIISDVVAVPVSAGATALVGGDDESGGGACIVALDPEQSGVRLSGGTKLSAPECDIASNAAVTAPCGTEISAQRVTYGSSLDHCIWNNNVKEIVAQQTVTDPFEGHAGIAAAWARAAGLGASIGLPDPYPTHWTYNNSNNDIHFGWDQNQTKQQAAAAGCSASFESSKWTLDCTTKWKSDGWVQFRNVSAAGGINVDFAPESTQYIGKLHHSDWPRFKITGSVHAASNWKLGGGHWFIRQGLRVSGSGDASFDRGYFNIGSGAFNCSGAYSICNEGARLTFGSRSEFHIQRGVHTASGQTDLGSGDGNSYRIASPDGTGLAVSVASGRFRTGDIGGTAFFGHGENVFRLNGSVQSAGGSCVWFGDAAQHDVDGSMTFAGGVRLGDGMWSVNGSLGLGANGGGNVNCFGRDISLSAENVTLVLTAKGAKSSGSCGTAVFCATAGYRNVTLTAPTSGPTAGIAVIGPQAQNVDNGALFAAGATSARISGAFYFPNGPLDMSGGAGVGGGSGACFQAIATRVTLTGGTTGASNCVMKDENGGPAASINVRVVR